MQIYEARPSLSLIHSVVKPRSSSFSPSYIYASTMMDFWTFYSSFNNSAAVKISEIVLNEDNFFLEQLSRGSNEKPYPHKCCFLEKSFHIGLLRSNLYIRFVY